MQTFVVTSVACFDEPSLVAAAVREEFDIHITRQAIEAYDPTKFAGRDLAERWAQLFWTTREAFLADTARVGISHRAASGLSSASPAAQRMTVISTWPSRPSIRPTGRWPMSTGVAERPGPSRRTMRPMQRDAESYSTASGACKHKQGLRHHNQGDLDPLWSTKRRSGPHLATVTVLD